MASPPPSPFPLNRLESTSDYRGLHEAFAQHLHPFEDYIPHAFNSIKTSEKSNKNKNNTPHTESRTLAKQFLPFLNRSLKLLPIRLTDSLKPGRGSKEEELAAELLGAYKLCVECLYCVSKWLDGKPFSVHFYKVKLVRCLEVWGRFEEAELEGFGVLESLRSANSKKKAEIFLPELTRENEDVELAGLVAEMVLNLVKCVFRSRRKENGLYRRVLLLYNQLKPWLRLLDSKAMERWEMALVTGIYKCTVVMLEEEEGVFDADLVHKFCMTTLNECVNSSMKGELFKFAWKICSYIDSQWDSRPTLIVDVLECALDSIARDCKVDYSIKECFYLVHYCTQRCRRANIACREVSQGLEKLASKFVQVSGPICSILRLYATGLYFTDAKFLLRFSESGMEDLDITIPLDSVKDLQPLSESLSSLVSYFSITSNQCGSSTDFAENGLGSMLCSRTCKSLCCRTCKSEPENAYFLSYLSALSFFCQPFAEFIVKEYKHFVAEEEFATSSNTNCIQGAFHQFCDAFLMNFSYNYTATKEIDTFNECQNTLLKVAISAFIFSLRTDKNVQENMDRITHLISRGWLQSKEMKFIVPFLHNIGAILYNNKHVKLASLAFEICCKASWVRVLLLCNKFIEKSEGDHEDWSEEAISSWVTEACAKGAIFLDALHKCGSPDIHRGVLASLLNWSVAANLFASLHGPMPLLRKWVEIMCKDCKNVDVVDGVPILYSLMSKSYPTMKRRTIAIILEQELLAYEEKEAANMNLCQRMQLRIIDIILSNVYVTQDYCLQKSKNLIKKARVYRAFGIGGVNNCIQCLSDAISILVEMSDESLGSDSLFLHHLALAYFLRALCTQESQPNSEVILNDIQHALKLWLGIDWFRDANHEFVTENAMPLLFCIGDLLSLKGYFQLQHETFKLIIVLLKRKSMPLDKCLAILWADRKLSHALCTTPMHEDFITSLTQRFGADSNNLSFWINCIKDSQPLLNGFCQKFSLSDFFISQFCCCRPGKPLVPDVSVDQIKEAVLALDSDVHVPSTVFFAAHLCFDLSERFISNGQLIEALSFARESLRLRTKLWQKKFIFKNSNQPKNNSETEETIQQHGYGHNRHEVFGSVAAKVWPYSIGSLNLETCNLSPWNVLQCYLESILQVGTIYEKLGNASLAEAYLVRGKQISCSEELPIFRVAFASALGEIYCKKQYWDLAESQLDSANQIILDSSTAISCKQCALTMGVTIDQRIGDLTSSRSNSITRSPSVNYSSDALNLYRSALKKLNHPGWGVTFRKFEEREETNQGDKKVCCSQKVGGARSHVKMESVMARKPKKAAKSIAKKQDLKPEANIRMTRSRARFAHARSELVDEIESECTENFSENYIPACLDTHGLSRPSLALNRSSTTESGIEEVPCLGTNCWGCLLIKVTETGSMQDFIHMKWEFKRRRLSLRLLTEIGKCMRNYAEIHETHEIFWQSISVLVNRQPLVNAHSASPHSILLEIIGKERHSDAFSTEHAEMLYNLSWFSLKNICDHSRSACCDLCQIDISSILSWLLQAFILGRETPLLFQKVSRLLAMIFLLSTLGEPFSFGPYSEKTLSVSYWAAFFHQASLGSGTDLNQRVLSNSNEQKKRSQINGSLDQAAEVCNLLRLAPENVDNLEHFVTNFFQSLPSITVICISLLGPDYISLLKDLLPRSSSPTAFVLLSRLNSNDEPIIMLLPYDFNPERLDSDDDDDDDGKGNLLSVYEGYGSMKKWCCPWGATTVDDMAPQFKQILEENYVSSIVPPIDTKEIRSSWWAWRKRLDYRLSKFLSGIEESWFGPWKCLLLGAPVDSTILDSVVPNFMSALNCIYDCHANHNLLSVILGGATSVSQAETCVSQLLLRKGCITSCGCFSEEKCKLLSTACDDAEILSRMPRQSIIEAISQFEVENIIREPIVLVLDSDVQMLPWENLPVLRKQEVYRMPSVGSISALLNTHHKSQVGKIDATFPSIDPLDAFYLLNPSGDLSYTQLEFEEWFRDQKLEGKAGAPPKAEELLLALERHDLFLYFGHGCGTRYIPRDEIQKLENCAATLLMGCSSGSLSLSGCYNPEGAALSYLLAGSPAIIANLWEITDKDIDRFAKALLDGWMTERSTSSTGCNQCNLVEEFESMNIGNCKGKKTRKQAKGKKSNKECDSSKCKECFHRPRIGSFISQAREACVLPMLIGAAPVCYGVPTVIRKKKDL